MDHSHHSQHSHHSHHSHNHGDPHEQQPDFFHIIPYEIPFQSPEDQKKLNVETLELKDAYSISFWFTLQNNPDSISKFFNMKTIKTFQI